MIPKFLRLEPDIERGKPEGHFLQVGIRWIDFQRHDFADPHSPAGHAKSEFVILGMIRENLILHIMNLKTEYPSHSNSVMRILLGSLCLVANFPWIPIFNQARNSENKQHFR
jgi:hypothetical protein